MATITAANAVFTLSIEDLYPVGQRIQGWSSDDAFTTEALDMTETVMGIDGHLSGGFVFNPVDQTITVMPDSPSIEVFENWQASMRTLRETLVATATIQLPAINRRFTLTRGFLISAPPIASVQRTLQPMGFQVRWEKVTSDQV